MTFTEKFRRDWLSNIRGDVLAGIVVALALIPEAIGFSIIAGVDPKVGLYASVIIAMVISIAGGRPAMISAATAATAVLFGTLVREHGLAIPARRHHPGRRHPDRCRVALRVGYIMRFVSRSVMTGFVNALAILIFMAQLPELIGVSWQTYAMIAAGLAIIYLFPRLTRLVPSPLVCILVLTAIVADASSSTCAPSPTWANCRTRCRLCCCPTCRCTLETLWIILPYSIAVAAVGLLESLLTASIVDQMTDTGSDKNRESRSAKASPTSLSGFFGGMAGCAMIGQSVINVKSGGRTRLSTFAAGAFLLFLLMVLGDWVGLIPMPALVAIMIMVSIGTFSWSSLAISPPPTSLEHRHAGDGDDRGRHAQPGARRRGRRAAVRHFLRLEGLADIPRHLDPGGWRRAHLSGRGPAVLRVGRGLPRRHGLRRERLSGSVIDVSTAHIWDLTGVNAIDMAVLKFRRAGAEVEVIGMNDASATIMDKLAVHDQPGAMERMLGH